GRTTSLAVKSTPYYDVVADFGATGDNRTNDLPAFVAAIEALGPRDTPLGSTLYVPPGTYLLDGDLVIDRNMILHGVAGTATASLSSTSPRGTVSRSRQSLSPAAEQARAVRSKTSTSIRSAQERHPYGLLPIRAAWYDRVTSLPSARPHLTAEALGRR